MKVCLNCEGSGIIKDSLGKRHCDACNGTGKEKGKLDKYGCFLGYKGIGSCGAVNCPGHGDY